jgi:hypothetical protein
MAATDEEDTSAQKNAMKNTKTIATEVLSVAQR